MSAKFTEPEMEAELAYRITERLGMLCGTATPTPEQLEIAQAEADTWETDWRLGV